MNGLALFAGAGGLELGLKIALGDSYCCVCYVERETYAAATLVARMEDKALDRAPIWDDVTTFDGKPWRGKVDLISGGFPCQDISVAGKGEGIKEGTRSGLWSEYSRIIREVRPRLVYVENVSALLARGIDRVLGDLADLGFDAEWMRIAAGDVGAPHRRERVFILGYSRKLGLPRLDRWGPREESSHGCCVLADAERPGIQVPQAGRPEGKGRETSASSSGRRRLAGSGSELSEATSKRNEKSVLGPDDPRGKGQRDHAGDALSGSKMADTTRRKRKSRSRRERVLDEREALHGDRNGQKAHGPTCELCRPFPPGPGDRETWERILADHPELAPAVAVPKSGEDGQVGEPPQRRDDELGNAADGKEGATGDREATPRPAEGQEAQSALRGMADGMANLVDQCPDDAERWHIPGYCVDEVGLREWIREREEIQSSAALQNRVDRLRACGNGVVPLQAAVAFVELSRRLALRIQ